MNIREHRSLIASLSILLGATSRGGITGWKGRKVFKSHDIVYLSQLLSRNVANLNSITLLSYSRRNPTISNTKSFIVFFSIKYLPNWMNSKGNSFLICMSVITIKVNPVSLSILFFFCVLSLLPFLMECLNVFAFKFLFSLNIHLYVDRHIFLFLKLL